MKVYLAIVHWKDGAFPLAGATKEELIGKLHMHVLDQGGPEEWFGSYKPKDRAEIEAMSPDEAVEKYFEDHPSEYVEEETDEITLPGPVPHLAALDDSYRPQGTAIEGRAR